MIKKILAIVVCIFLIIIAIQVKVIRSEELNRTIFVDDDGGVDYTTIQEALDNTNNGDTIFVQSGIYYENIEINKSINLIGENKDKTIIDGNKIDDVVNINHDNVLITGFKITNSGSINNAGIKVNSNSNKISDNIIVNNSAGIRIIGVSENYVNGNNISYNKNGIILFIGFKENIITGNFIKNNYNDGIYLYRSENNIIIDNSIIDNKYNGINFHLSQFNTIYHNNFVNNSIDAFDIWDNNWYNSTIKEGNYWYNYLGIDSNGDGIGDISYNISGGVNQDIYPLISYYNTKEELDKNLPFVDFLRPINAIYINDNEIISFFITVIIGDFEIVPIAYDNETDISSIRLYINDDLVEVFTFVPNSYIWNELTFGKKTIRIVAYDTAGNEASKEIVIWKFF